MSQKQMESQKQEDDGDTGTKTTYPQPYWDNFQQSDHSCTNADLAHISLGSDSQHASKVSNHASIFL